MKLDFFLMARCARRFCHFKLYFTRACWLSFLQAQTCFFSRLIADMTGHCGLNAWQHNSAIRHLTSSTPEGPYTPHEIILAPFAHNPTVQRATDGTYLIFHIGDGTSGHRPPYTNCSHGQTPAQPARNVLVSEEIPYALEVDKSLWRRQFPAYAIPLSPMRDALRTVSLPWRALWQLTGTCSSSPRKETVLSQTSCTARHHRVPGPHWRPGRARVVTTLPPIQGSPMELCSLSAR
jgi:hypothetical protein